MQPCLYSGQTYTHVRKLSWQVGALWGCQIRVVSHEWVTDNHTSQWVIVLQKHFLLVKLKIVNRQDTSTWKSLVLVKSRSFLFPASVSFRRFLKWFRFSFAYFARQQSFLMSSFETLRVKLKLGRPELIPSRMPDVWPPCFMPQVLWINTIF